MWKKAKQLYFLLALAQLYVLPALTQKVLIFGCQKGLMIFFPLLLISWGLISNQNILLLGMHLTQPQTPS